MAHLGYLLTALADGQLSPATAEKVLEHVAACRPCANELAAERRARRMLAESSCSAIVRRRAASSGGGAAHEASASSRRARRSAASSLAQGRHTATCSRTFSAAAGESWPSARAVRR